MTAKRKDLTYMTGDGDAEAQALPTRLTPARKRELLAAKRSPDIATLSDEEVELLWGSLDDEARRQYLGAM